MVVISIAAAVGLVVLIAESIHLRRVKVLAPLAFGPGQHQSAWTHFAPLFRLAACVALAWGITTLVLLKPKSFRPEGSVQPGKEQHLMIVLDVSPSMRLEDAGPTQKQSRKDRAREVMRSLFERVPVDQYLVSVIAVYNGAKPVVVDSRDLDVVDGILGDLPLYHAFESGQTRLLDGLNEGAKIAKPWNPSSTTIILLSDGDTVPPKGLKPMPVSVGSVIVVGLGDPLKGSFIDGRQSKQDSFTLQQIATRLGGIYHDGNRNHLSTNLISEIVTRGNQNMEEPWTKREYALAAIACGGVLFAMLPLLLELFGRSYYPGVREFNRRTQKDREHTKSERVSSVSV